MVRAILDGRKTQTRRVFKPERMEIRPHAKGGFYYETFAKRNGKIESTGQGPFIPTAWLHYCPYGVAGDRLWVKETHLRHGYWSFPSDERRKFHPTEGKPVHYLGDNEFDDYRPPKDRTNRAYYKRPSIFMPRWASRITLEITKVRVERLQSITEADAMAEGVIPRFRNGCPIVHDGTGAACIEAYSELWDQINGKGEWDKNPWVWVLEFRRL